MSTLLEKCQKFQVITGITGAQMVSAENQTGMNLKIVTWICDADEAIQKLWTDWKFLLADQVINITTGIDEYALASLGITDLVEWDGEQFYINPGSADYRKLTNVPFNEWRSSTARLGVKLSSEPTRVVIKPDNSLVFIDKPDANYTVWGNYFRKPTRMTVNSSTSAIPVAFENIILHRAKMFYAEYYENGPLFNEAEKTFLSELVALESAQLPDNESRSKSANNAEDNRIEAV